VLTQERLKELLHYDAGTGAFSWRKSRKGQNPTPGNVNVRGYLVITIDYKHYLAQRLAFLYTTGNWPTYGADHEDGNPANNRWLNLRDVPQRTNRENQRRPRRDNTTGLLGVERSGGRFAARIVARGQRHYLGTFDTAEAAHNVYVAAKRLLHPGCTL
jgi:hypothetical protein